MTRRASTSNSNPSGATPLKSAAAANAPREFAGTGSVRQLRVLEALAEGPMTRERLDRVAGASNGPDIISRLRQRGLQLPCVLVATADRDGRTCHRGVYHLSHGDRQKLARWAAQRGPK